MARVEDQRVVISGLGMVTPLGVGRSAFWQAVLQGRSAARPVEHFDVTGFSTRFACQVPPSFDPASYVENRKSLKLMSRAASFASAAAALALEDAGLPKRAEHPERAGVAMGVGGVGLHDLDHLKTSVEISAELHGWKPRDGVVATVCRHLHPLTPLKLLPNITAGHVAIAHHLEGESITVCTACTSATQAIGEALRVLRRGEMDWMLAGGTDAMINPMGLLGFGMLGVLSTRNEDPGHASRPFDSQRDGFVMGEGAVLLVLERADHALARGANVLAELAERIVVQRVTLHRGNELGTWRPATKRFISEGRPPATVICVTNASSRRRRPRARRPFIRATDFSARTRSSLERAPTQG